MRLKDWHWVIATWTRRRKILVARRLEIMVATRRLEMVDYSVSQTNGSQRLDVSDKAYGLHHSRTGHTSAKI